MAQHRTAAVADLHAVPDAPSLFDADDWTIAEIEEAIDACKDPAVLDVLIARLQYVSTRWVAQDFQVIPDGDWAIFAFLAGRYTGKTDTGSDAINRHMEGPPCDPRVPGGHRGRLVGPTHNDTVASCVNGATGIKAHNPEVELVGSKEGTLVRWPGGAVARVMGAYTPEDVERFRAAGNSCFDWYEELAAWRQLDKALEQAEFGLRLGPNPKAIITTSPKNRTAIKRLKVLGERYASDPTSATARFERVHLRIATTNQNRYGNPDVRASLYARYAGTRLGQQELNAEIVDDLGLMYSRIWFDIVDVPAQWPSRVRYWDLAATDENERDDPDWTAGALVAYDPTRRPWKMPDGTVIVAGRYQIQHIIRFREQPGEVQKLILATARSDGPGTRQVIEKDPGQAGKDQIANYKQLLAGVAPFSSREPSGSKIVRAELPSGAAQQGRISVVRGNWNEDWFDEAEEFPGGAHDDQVDAVSGAFAELGQGVGVGSVTRPSARPGPARTTVGVR